MGNPKPTPSTETRRTSRPRFWLRRLMVILLILTPVLAWQGWQFYKFHLRLPAEAPGPRLAVGQPVYVLVLGVDKRTEDVGRSDTLLLVRLGSKNQFIDIVSIPRDTIATFPDGRQDKINSAYSTGGPELVTQVVSDLLSISVLHYVKIDLESFERIVDKLGGVDITVDRHYLYSDPVQDLEIDIKAGPQHMNGSTALKYVRIRFDGVTNDDIARIKRQQQFMEAIRTRLTSPSAWLKIPDLISTMRKYVTTNVPEADQLDLAEGLFEARGNLAMETLPGEPDDATGDWLLERDRWNEVMQIWKQR